MSISMVGEKDGEVASMLCPTLHCAFRRSRRTWIYGWGHPALIGSLQLMRVIPLYAHLISVLPGQSIFPPTSYPHHQNKEYQATWCDTSHGDTDAGDSHGVRDSGAIWRRRWRRCGLPVFTYGGPVGGWILTKACIGRVGRGRVMSEDGCYCPGALGCYD